MSATPGPAAQTPPMLTAAQRRLDALEAVLTRPEVVAWQDRVADLAVSHLMDSGMTLGSTQVRRSRRDQENVRTRTHHWVMTDPASGAELLVSVMLEGMASKLLFGSFRVILGLGRADALDPELGPAECADILAVELLCNFDVVQPVDDLDWGEVLFRHLFAKLVPQVLPGQTPHLEIALGNFRAQVDERWSP